MKIILKSIMFLASMIFTSTALCASYNIIEDTKFKTNLPYFREAIQRDWPEQIPFAHYYAGQIEQESCASKKKCWNENTELFTYEDMRSGKRREYGFGLGQLTITPRFNNFEEMKKNNKLLRDWQFKDRFNAEYQMIALFTLDRICYKQSSFASKEKDRHAMMFSCYNGGAGGLFKDRAICQKTKGCNPTLWYGNIENYSTKSKAKQHGYGKSFFEINREYPVLIMDVRANKYIPYLKFPEQKK